LAPIHPVSLEFGILLLFCLILLAFPMLILLDVGLTERALLVLVIFLDLLDRKSTSGTCHFLGSSLVYWSSQKQFFVAQSIIGAEYVATASCYSQIV
jgi:hypothetical protein